MDDIGTAAMEFAIGVLALDLSKDELVTYLAGRLKEVGMGRLSVARFGQQGCVDQSDWSSIVTLGGYADAHPRLREAVIARLGAVKAAAPAHQPAGDPRAS